ncbi:MAG: hypothetical protein JNL10_12960 [Verrucomicrobiales bacterium]|nr:hypothetical protein [Verrucomicrobiales bacterium]
MKRFQRGGWAAVTWMVLMGAAAAAVAEEPSAPPVGATNRTLSFPVSVPGVADAPVPDAPAPAATVVLDGVASAPVESEVVAGATISAEPITTSIALETPPSPLTQPDQEVQRRLEAPSPEVLMERHGTVGFLIRNPEPRNFLEVINPFAPEDFGPQVRETYNRDPNLKPGATLPRNFVNDMTHEPTGLGLFHWEW